MNNKIKYCCCIAMLLLLCCNKIQAKDRTRKDSEKEFQIAFNDTAFTYDATLTLHYDDSLPNPYIITIKNVKDSIILSEPLAITNFETKLNGLLIKELKINHSVRQFSLLEIFIWVQTRVNADNNTPIAGVLNLNTQVKFFLDNREDEHLSYEDRVNMIDSLTDKLKVYKASVEIFKRDVADMKVQLHTLDSLTFKNDSIQSEITGFKAQITSMRSSQRKIYDLEKHDIPKLEKLQTQLKQLPDSIGTKPTSKTKNELRETFKAIDTNKILDTLNHNYQELKKQLDGRDIVNFSEIKSFEYYVTQQLEELKRELNQRKKIEPEITTLNTKGMQLNFVINQVKDADRIKILKRDTLNRSIDSINKLLNTFNQELRTFNIASVKRIDMQFEKGFLENIKVILDVNGRETIFENSYAIGFTSKSNYRALKNIKLFARLGNNTVHIWLIDILRNYDNEIDLYTRDYSPADTLIKIDPNINSKVALYKASFIKLFETKFFTDIDALANKQPNGLVQFEVSRRININTQRYQVKNEINYGFANYVNIYGGLNKIEKNFKFLPLRNDNVVLNNKVISPSYATNMDYLQYRNFTVGFEANAFLYDVPGWKNTTKLDLGLQYGHTPVQDSSRIVDASGIIMGKNDTIRYDANLITFYPKFTFEVFPERRLGVSLSYQFQYTWLFSNNNFKQVTSYAKSNTAALPIERNARISHMVELFMRLELQQASSSSLFFRTRLYWQQGDVNTYFPQIQFGYSYNINFTKLSK